MPRGKKATPMESSCESYLKSHQAGHTMVDSKMEDMAEPPSLFRIGWEAEYRNVLVVGTLAAAFAR
jgi:hypothetical protein